MRIAISDKAVQHIPVRLIEGTVSKFVEKDGAEDLRVARGKESQLSQRRMILLLRKIIATAKTNRVGKLALNWEELRALTDKKISDEKLMEIAATAFLMADFEFTKYKTATKDSPQGVSSVALLGAPKVLTGALVRGITIGQEVNACRGLCNTPGGDMTPALLASAAKAAAKGAGAGSKLKVTVLGRKEMQKIGMGAVLGIAKGSSEEPRFIIVEYWGAPKSRKPVVFVGKGVTFDTGGLNIKPGDHMYEMHMDMSGGAAAVHAVILAAKLDIDANVIALVPAVENSPGNEAVRPGDILTSLSGKTIEILNTDAEGRVILADAITYARRYNPALVADVATLTGAALIALGTQASAFMTNEKDLSVADYMRLAENSGDYIWPMPLWEEYDDMVKGTFADVPNISAAGNSRYGGVIAGGKFLEVFAKELNCPWVHLDIAPRMTSAPGEHLAKGAAGAPVRLLLALAEHYAHNR